MSVQSETTVRQWRVFLWRQHWYVYSRWRRRWWVPMLKPLLFLCFIKSFRLHWRIWFYFNRCVWLCFAWVCYMLFIFYFRTASGSLKQPVSMDRQHTANYRLFATCLCSNVAVNVIFGTYSSLYVIIQDLFSRLATSYRGRALLRARVYSC